MLLPASLDDIIAVFNGYGAATANKYTFPAPDPSVTAHDTATDKGLQVRVYTPEGYTGDKPVCLYYHGGGWAMGDIDGEDVICRAISKTGGIVVVSVAYGLAPQNKHPGLVDDCYNALLWALDNTSKLNTAKGKFLTAGASAGGQLSFGTALRAIDQGFGDQLVGCIALVPVTVHPDAVPAELKSRYTAMIEHEQHTVNTGAAMRTFWKVFGAPPTDPYASPLLHPRIKDLKKVYMCASSHDTLRDDAVLMKQKLDEAG